MGVRVPPRAITDPVALVSDRWTNSTTDSIGRPVEPRCHEIHRRECRLVGTASSSRQWRIPFLNRLNTQSVTQSFSIGVIIPRSEALSGVAGVGRYTFRSPMAAHLVRRSQAQRPTGRTRTTHARTRSPTREMRRELLNAGSRARALRVNEHQKGGTTARGCKRRFARPGWSRQIALADRGRVAAELRESADCWCRPQRADRAKAGHFPDGQSHGMPTPASSSTASAMARGIRSSGSTRSTQPVWKAASGMPYTMLVTSS